MGRKLIIKKGCYADYLLPNGVMHRDIDLREVKPLVDRLIELGDNISMREIQDRLEKDFKGEGYKPYTDEEYELNGHHLQYTVIKYPDIKGWDMPIE